MKPRLSLRARVLVGAVFWTAGLTLLASVALTRVMVVHRETPVRVHRALEGALPVVIGMICMAAGFLHVRSGLSGLDAVRRRLGDLHAGQARRLEGTYPAEVQPVVNDLNALLEQRDMAVDRALGRAGDLAHGLKTPLAVIAHEADRALAAGAQDAAAAVHQQVDRMRRQLDYHLAQARAASGRTAGGHCRIRDSAEALARTLSRLHADRRLTIDVAIDAEAWVTARRDDLDEMLGNLLDNACRFARSKVAISAQPVTGAVVIAVDDDGPGIAPNLRSAVLLRGVRADQSGPGTGLGLAIVRDVAELYDGSIAIGASPLGGLRAELRLPAPDETWRHH